LIRRARYLVAAAGSAAILAGAMTLAGATAASALAPAPSCATGVRCTNNSGNVLTTPKTFSHGIAGYYGADDLHTHYRFVSTVVTATPGLINLNGFAGKTPVHEGGVGVSLCDPTSGQAAQVSLGYDGTQYLLRWAVGTFGPSGSFTSDPCIQVGFLHPQFFHGFGTIKGVNPGDQVYLAIYYSTNGPFFHQFSFGAIDITQGIVRQAWSGGKFNLSLTEFGIGAFSGHNFIQGGAINPLDTFTNNYVTCYSCPGAVPITSVQPVNPFNAGGLYEAQFTNTSGQVQISPLDSLTPTLFKEWSGSTGGV
jgi:hypothetical protein